MQLDANDQGRLIVPGGEQHEPGQSMGVQYVLPPIMVFPVAQPDGRRIAWTNVLAMTLPNGLGILLAWPAR
jgi:hypothetical protein